MALVGRIPGWAHVPVCEHFGVWPTRREVVSGCMWSGSALGSGGGAAEEEADRSGMRGVDRARSALVIHGAYNNTFGTKDRNIS